MNRRTTEKKTIMWQLFCYCNIMYDHGVTFWISWRVLQKNCKLKEDVYTIKKEIRKMWKSIIQQYCENTTLHGFKYIISRDSNIVEKIVWMVVCILGLTFGVLLMLLIWQRFRQTPTVTTIDTTTFPIFGLNFPAVSICNYNKIYKPHALKLMEEMKRKGITDTEMQNFFSALPKLVRPDTVDSDNRRVLEILLSPDITIEDIMYELMQPCEKLLLRCAWEGVIKDCKKIFKTIKTIEGFCCAFNYHVDTSENSIFGVKASRRNMNVTSKVKPNMTADYPGVFEVLSVPGAGRDVGLSIVLDLEEDTYFGSIRPSVGASVLVHDPFHYPEVEVLNSFIQPTQEIAVIMSGSIMKSAPDIKNLDLTRRNCWFNDERKLNITPVYSYQSCITECRIRYIRRYCNCVPFYYPNYYQEKVCDLADINCLTKYRGSLSNLRSIIDIVSNENDTKDVKCECYPACNENIYNSVSENAIMANISFHSPIMEGYNVKNVSLASIYFRGITCLKYRKESWMSWDDLLASFGGIFGLCVGGSILSLVEFIYYFTNKIFFGNRKAQQNVIIASTPARDKFKVVHIDRLNDWTLKQMDNNASGRISVQNKINHINVNAMQSATSCSNLQEEFIKHFLKSHH